MLTAGIWAAGLLTDADNQVAGTLVLLATFAWFMILVFVGAAMLESRLEKHSGRQLPPQSPPRAGVPASQRPAPGASAGQTRQVEHGQPDTAEAARSDRPCRRSSPGLRPPHQRRHCGHGYTIGYSGN